MRAADLLADLGQVIGLPLAFDARGRCVLVCGDGLEVEIADLSGEALLLTATVAKPPPAGMAALYAAALQHAHGLQRTRGAALTANPAAGGRIELQSLRALAELTPHQFRQFVGDFILAAGEAASALGAAGHGPLDGVQAPPALDDTAFLLRL